MDKERRFFNRSERNAIFTAAKGLCQETGEPLEDSWHADHCVAWSNGGSTDLSNAQALNASANIRKGTRSRFFDSHKKPLTEWTHDLRDWQQDAFDKFQVRDKPVFLAVATPGAGKTIFGIRIVHHVLSTGLADRVVVVCPSTQLKQQWADAAANFSIQVDPICEVNGKEALDFHGSAITYQLVGSSSGAGPQRVHCGIKTIVIFDEIHHAGEAKSWGKAINYAFENAVACLCLSGTPFRTDNSKIPFISYDHEGRVIPDFIYSYADALNDDVCRPVFFPTYEGSLRWERDGNEFEATFENDLDEQGESDRLRTALWGMDWVGDVLYEANKKLSEVREMHSDAGGLVVAIDQNHARWIAKILKSVSLSDPIIVTSDDVEAHNKIEQFKNNADRWIVAVRMVSEGVDISRLRVCAYLSNVVSELFFRQVVGRVIRVIPGLSYQSAYVFIPSDSRIVDLARQLMDERDYAVLKKEGNEGGSGPDDLVDYISTFSSISATVGKDGLIYRGEFYSYHELESASLFTKNHNLPLSREQAAELIRRGLLNLGTGPVPVQQEEKPSAPLYKLKKESRKKNSDRRISIIKERWFSHVEEREAFRIIHGKLNAWVGCKGVKTASNEQLAKREKLINEAVASREMPPWII